MNKKMDEEIKHGIYPLIVNYLQGTATKEETEAVETWLSESDENRAHYKQLRNLWESSLDLPVSTELALNEVFKHLNHEHKRIAIWQVLQRVAAVLFIPLLLSVIWLGIGRNAGQGHQERGYQTVTAAFGSFTSLDLPDGSRVWLNSGSQLRYPMHFGGNTRKVYLSGEAYFEVHSDERSPFVVNTPYFAVSATGTRFNVASYRNFLTPSVTLLEGKVAIQGNSTYSENKAITILQPGQHLEYDTLQGRIIVETEDTYKYVAWKDGKLVFRNDLLSEVAQRISLQYNVDIQVIGDQINRNRYRATFENEPLNELLRLLKISAPIDYKEISPVLQPDSSFSRRKIIIYSTNELTQ